MKRAVLSIDVEDWYHLEYFDRRQCDTSVSMMDDLEQYLKILTDYSITSSFFVLNEIAQNQLSFFQDLSRQGFDIGSHGTDHTRPLAMSTEAFRDDVSACFETMMRINGKAGFGYRAPCFSIGKGWTLFNSKVLPLMQVAWISLTILYMAPLIWMVFRSALLRYSRGKISLSSKQQQQHYWGGEFLFLAGAYLRIIPWQVKRYLISRYLSSENLYVLYIHPFELSKQDLPAYPPNTPPSVKFRFSAGRRSCADRLRKVIELLMSSRI